MKKLRYIFEAIFAQVMFWFFRLVGIDAASALGGKFAKIIGKFLKINESARENIKLAMPELSNEEVEKILSDSWENLGRTAGEFPHVNRLKGEKFDARVKINGREIVEKIAAEGRGFIIFSGHFANWEICPKSACEIGHPLALVYRRANNPWVEKLIQNARKGSHAGIFPKGKEAAKNLLKTIANKGSIGMLVDQKMNDGIAVPFFGRDAMTAPALAEFATRFNMPLIPARVVRKNGAYFELTIYPPLNIENKNTLEIMTEVNQLFESWIRENPGQWLWMHKRWPKE